MKRFVGRCACGGRGRIERIGEWPAQYQVKCVACGRIVLGEYYGSHDRVYRHRAAMTAARNAWIAANSALCVKSDNKEQP